MQPRTEELGKHCFLDMAVDAAHLQTGSLMPANCSSEASAPSYSQSTSSTIVSPANPDLSDAPCESSAQSGSTSLKEQDYMGMSDISSSTATKDLSERKQLPCNMNLNIEEPDLRLGLGPSPAKGGCDSAALHLFSQPNRDNIRSLVCASQPRVGVQEAANVVFDVAQVRPYSSSSGGDSSMPTSKRMDAVPIPSFPCSNPTDPISKSVKRLFSDMVPQVASEGGPAAYVNAGVGMDDVKTGALFAPGAVRMIMQRPDVAPTSITNQSQMSYWGSSRPPSWHSEFAHSNNPYGQVPCRKHSDGPRAMGVDDLDSVPAEAPPAKEQVVGWPPVRSYRRSAINLGRSRSAGTDTDGHVAMYVKVNMDGIPIGRKVDLNAYKNYEELLSALEGMFYSPPIGEGVRFLHARDFVLTYEDKEGDWMLVGDVPWGMFVNTVKRLRITRGSDSACLGSSTSKNLS